MKPKGIWMIIGLILVTGIGTTAYIRDYTQNTELAETRQVQAFSEAAAPVSKTEKTGSDGIAMANILPGESAVSEDTEAVLKAEASAEAGAEAAEELAEEPVEAAAEPAALSAPAPDLSESGSELPEASKEPDAAAPAMARAVPSAFGAAENEAVEAEGEGTNLMLERLEDLDEQIAKSQSKKAGDTTNSQKAASETERKLWEAELSRFLDVLETRLDKEEKDALMKEQNEWIRQRENKALEASGKQNNSVRQELEYNISMADSTRTRVYQLAQEYGEILSEAEK